MVLIALTGAGFGLGIVVIVRGLFPPRMSLADALAALHRPPVPAPIAEQGEARWLSRVGRFAVPLLRSTGLPGGRLRRDLQTLGRDVDRHLAEKVAAGAAGLLIPSMLLFSLQGMGAADLGMAAPLAVVLLCGLAMFVLPDAAVRREAAERRREMRHTLSALLDLAVVALAGGAGVEQSLADASAVTKGWAATQIRRALDTASLSRTPPWGALARLGDELDVTELQEFAATIALAGSEGARVRESLSAKAAGLRERLQSEAQAEAVAATERMALPLAMLFLAFLIFIGYPALSHVMTGL
ncbi:type II secretion system F family protein [Yinghuangia soli]|uniref:Type II secretion system F family protein n=1 Tax=Yinghuangia soli TaxID=2908204 RepID=A0AA41Q4G8_9ACTN|nr:type II secretion system F family protein [Yinghuangia soli]MCF2531161.1 type II secretion system F family protein [Yinghuangia soli]